MSEFIRGLKDPKNDDELDPDYVTTVTFQLFFAGHETTVNATAGGMRALLENRKQWQELCADPSLVTNAVEECLRAASSVIAWRRRTLDPVTLHGVDIPAGAKLLIYNGAANHDAAVFDDGETFDIHRANARRHLSFGYGAHLCLGAPLARLEVRVMLEELSRRLPHMHLAPDQQWRYSPNTSFRGPRELRVYWDPARNPLPADRPAATEDERT